MYFPYPRHAKEKRWYLGCELPPDVEVTAGGDIRTQSSEKVVGEIDGLALASPALVDEFAGCGLTVKGESGHAAAVGVTVRLCAEHVWKKCVRGKIT